MCPGPVAIGDLRDDASHSSISLRLPRPRGGAQHGIGEDKSVLLGRTVAEFLCTHVPGRCFSYDDRALLEEFLRTGRTKI